MIYEAEKLNLVVKKHHISLLLLFYTNTVKQYNDIQKFLKQEELYLNNYLGGAAVGVWECHPPQIGPAN